jgi:hypothetical protein
MNSKRVVVTNEPESSETISTGQIMELSGTDMIDVRKIKVKLYNYLLGILIVILINKNC